MASLCMYQEDWSNTLSTIFSYVLKCLKSWNYRAVQKSVHTKSGTCFAIIIFVATSLKVWLVEECLFCLCSVSFVTNKLQTKREIICSSFPSLTLTVSLQNRQMTSCSTDHTHSKKLWLFYDFMILGEMAPASINTLNHLRNHEKGFKSSPFFPSTLP